MRVLGIDHVQVAAPPGSEEAARAFYGSLLGLPEIPKPEILAGRGGVWFQCGAQQIHLGIEEDFRPARKAHPAFVVEELHDLERALAEAGHRVLPGEDLPGLRRVFVADPFGNRIELFERT